MLLLILVAASILGGTALACAIAFRRDFAVLAIGTSGCVLACALGAVASVTALLNPSDDSIRFGWAVPVGEIHLGLDPLSAFFLLCIFVVSGLAAVYGAGYLGGYLGKRRLAPAMVFFNLLVAAMVGIVIARDGVLFLMAWELMSVTSFFLVTFESERPDVRRAGLTYLIASHLGVAFLFALFALFARYTGSFDLDALVQAGPMPARLAALCFTFALIGFGTKAGFWPFHIWLPDAHPAAPSHVSALMSGVMIKMGIYGLLRVLMMIGPAPSWWGIVLLAVGASSALAGVIHALAQRDLKRLLAYSSVENIGLVAIGIGLGILGQSHGHPVMALLGYGGALLHVLNHGLFKGLLFQTAGSVLHGSGERDLDVLGGLNRRMPFTALSFLVGSLAIAGLPSFNGFISEWMIYLGAFRGAAGLPTTERTIAVMVVAALALIGGLASACFIRAYGVVFLGEPRTKAASEAHEASAPMRFAMGLGGLLCFGIGLMPAVALRLVGPAAASLGRTTMPNPEILGSLDAITRGVLVLLVTIVALTALRKFLLMGREIRSAGTWACGYPSLTPRMQYTAASFAEPLLAPFSVLLHRRVEADGPAGYFPSGARYEEQLGDVAGERLLLPAVRRGVGLMEKFRAIQHGRVQLYLAYIFFTLLALLALRFGGLLGR